MLEELTQKEINEVLLDFITAGDSARVEAAGLADIDTVIRVLENDIGSAAVIKVLLPRVDEMENPEKRNQIQEFIDNKMLDIGFGFSDNFIPIFAKHVSGPEDVFNGIKAIKHGSEYIGELLKILKDKDDTGSVLQEAEEYVLKQFKRCDLSWSFKKELASLVGVENVLEDLGNNSNEYTFAKFMEVINDSGSEEQIAKAQEIMAEKLDYSTYLYKVRREAAKYVTSEVAEKAIKSEEDNDVIRSLAFRLSELGKVPEELVGEYEGKPGDKELKKRVLNILDSVKNEGREGAPVPVTSGDKPQAPKNEM